MQDGTAMLWDLAEGKKLYSLEANETIHSLCFSPNRYWLCAATDTAIKVHPPLSEGRFLHIQTVLQVEMQDLLLKPKLAEGTPKTPLS